MEKPRAQIEKPLFLKVKPWNSKVFSNQNKVSLGFQAYGCCSYICKNVVIAYKYRCTYVQVSDGQVIAY